MPPRALVEVALARVQGSGFDLAYDTGLSHDMGVTAAHYADRSFDRTESGDLTKTYLYSAAMAGQLALRQMVRLGVVDITAAFGLVETRVQELATGSGTFKRGFVDGLVAGELADAAFEYSLPPLHPEKGTRWPNGLTRVDGLSRVAELVEACAMLWFEVERRERL